MSVGRSLASNRVEEVAPGVLQACRRLARLDLRANPLPRLHARALDHLPHLTTLYVLHYCQCTGYTPTQPDTRCTAADPELLLGTCKIHKFLFVCFHSDDTRRCLHENERWPPRPRLYDTSLITIPCIRHFPFTKTN